MSQPSPSVRTGQGKEMPRLPPPPPRPAEPLQRRGERNLTGLGPRGPWPVQTGPAVPLTLVGSTPLARSRVCEGVGREDI